MFVVFLCTGIWHGAAYKFILWGIWHGIFVIAERILKAKCKAICLPDIIKWLYTTVAVIVGWVLFRSYRLQYAIEYIKAMFGFTGKEFTQYTLSYFMNMRFIIVLVVGILFAIGIPCRINEYLKKTKYYFTTEYLSMIILFILLLLSLVMVVNGNYSPYIYFRF